MYVIQNLLCRSIPAPPPNVNTTLPADTGTTTTRQRLEAHRENPACAACHQLFDPVGVSFEHYDAIGAYREQEHGLAIDTSGALDGIAFDGPAALAALLHDSDEVARCLVAGAYRYNTAHNVENEADGEGLVIDELTSAFHGSGNNYAKLLVSLVEHPAFRHAVGQY